MKLYGILNDRDGGDKIANVANAVKTSTVGTRHNCLRSSKAKRRTRTQMKKRFRTKLKRELSNDQE